MNILMVSVSRIIEVSKMWTLVDACKVIIFLLSLAGVCVAVSILSSAKISDKIEKNAFVGFVCTLIIFSISTAIGCIPMSTNVNSSDFFSEPYIAHTYYHTSNGQLKSDSNADAPITIAHRYQRTKFRYNQHKDLMNRYSKILAHIKSAHDTTVPKSLLVKYKRNIKFNHLSCLKLSFKLQKYQAYLDKLPAKDVKYPAFWMGI